MIATILVFLLAYLWLLYETDCLRVRLPMGKARQGVLMLPMPKPLLMLPLGITKPKYARYQVFHSLKTKRYLDPIHEGSNIPKNAKTYYVPTYQIFLSTGVEPMCGYEWLDRHCADMVDYEQKLEMNIGNVRYNMTIKSPEIIADIMKVNKLSKQERNKLAQANPLLDYGNKVIRRKSKKLVKVGV